MINKITLMIAISTTITTTTTIINDNNNNDDDNNNHNNNNDNNNTNNKNNNNNDNWHPPYLEGSKQLQFFWQLAQEIVRNVKMLQKM